MFKVLLNWRHASCSFSLVAYGHSHNWHHASYSFSPLAYWTQPHFSANTCRTLPWAGPTKRLDSTAPVFMGLPQQIEGWSQPAENFALLPWHTRGICAFSFVYRIMWMFFVAFYFKKDKYTAGGMRWESFVEIHLSCKLRVIPPSAALWDGGVYVLMKDISVDGSRSCVVFTLISLFFSTQRQQYTLCPC